jgi:subtilisin family serine protease
VRVSGTVQFHAAVRATIVESEPNDTIDDSQRVGDVRLAERVVAVGHVDATDDVLDGYHFTAPARLRVSVSLSHAPAADLDVLVYDATGMQFVETYQTATQPETGVFHAKGSFDVVVRATAGSSNYELSLLCEAPAAPILEIEPNDGPGSARYLGEVAPGDVLTFRGSATLGADGADAFLVPCPAAVRLTFSLAFPAFQDLDVLVFDATTDALAPTPMAQFQATTPSPETGLLDVPAGRLLHVEARTKGAGGPWTLSIVGAAPPVPVQVSLLRDPAPRLAPLSAEASRLRAGGGVAPFGRAPRPAVRGEAVVSLEEGREAEGEAEIAARGGRIVERSGPRRRVVFDLPAGEPDEDAARRTLSRARAFDGGGATEFAATNGICQPTAEPNDPLYDLQWHYELIRLPEAWDVTTGDSQVIVAVVDTGIVQHPDIPTPISGYDFIADPSSAGDGDGRDGDPTDEGDGFGGMHSFHGTHIGGTIGAVTNNEVGVAAVCWNVRLLHLRGLGRRGGTDFDLAEAVRYAARLTNVTGLLPSEAARVVNMSFGRSGFSPTMESACSAAREAGVVLVAAAGNDTSGDFFTPAGYASVINVGAVGYAKELSSFSNFGPTIDLVAPGGEYADQNADGYNDGVLSTWRSLYYDEPMTYQAMRGTSVASPHVAGVAALVLAVAPTLTPAQVQDILQDTAYDLGFPGTDVFYGHGLVDAYSAVVRATGGPPPTLPRLRLEEAFLNFGSGALSLDAAVTNIGGGVLHVNAPVVEDAAQVPWLSAARVQPGDATKDTAALRVTVDRTGLVAGSYFGRVAVDSDGGSVVLQVLMTVSFAPPPVPDIDIRVQAVDVVAGGVVLETVVNPKTGLTFLFGALSVGRYRFYATSDVDGDDVGCEVGEYCGAYPLISDPVILDLVAGVDVSNIVLPVHYVSGSP